MADIDLAVVVFRNALGLPPLNCNDGIIYRAGEQLMGEAVSFNRNQVGSPYVDGQITTSRQRQAVNEQLSFEVFGRTTTNANMTNVQLKANFDIIAAAFLQDSYELRITIDGALYRYQGEAADLQLTWTGPRFMAKQGQIAFTMPRQPSPLVGVV